MQEKELIFSEARLIKGLGSINRESQKNNFCRIF